MHRRQAERMKSQVDRAHPARMQRIDLLGQSGCGLRNHSCGRGRGNCVAPVPVRGRAEVGNSLPTLRSVDGQARLANLSTRGTLVRRRDTRHRAPPVDLFEAELSHRLWDNCSGATPAAYSTNSLMRAMLVSDTPRAPLSMPTDRRSARTGWSGKQSAFITSSSPENSRLVTHQFALCSASLLVISDLRRATRSRSLSRTSSSSERSSGTSSGTSTGGNSARVSACHVDTAIGA
jgi:hypothetical protein